MDALVSAALEEVCARGGGGIPLLDLWADLRATSGLLDGVKPALWARLLAVPGLRFESQSLEESESQSLKVFAEEHLRDCFMGLYDLKARSSDIPPIQRRALERLAAARTDGITQSELAKEFGIKGNNMFYIVRNLEYQQLIVRQSTILRAKESGTNGENGLKNTSIVNTNLIHLYRYAKNAASNSHQRIEITRPDLLGTLGGADGSPLIGDGVSGECVKEDVRVKDYLPAMKAVCDKLEDATGKVLIVSDVKLALGYRKTPGHRAWRNILNRLKDASLVEEFPAKVNDRVVSCLRLLKKFDSKDFQLKPSTCGYDAFSEDTVKHGKRGQITDQLYELPIDHCIYDIVDAEGPKGITVPEVCERLGVNNKKTYARIAGMCSRFGMHVQAEIRDRTPLYRVWTLKNYQLYSANMSPGNCEPITDTNELSTQSRELVLYNQSSKNIQLDSCLADDILLPEKTHNDQLEGPSISSRDSKGNQLILSGTNTQSLAREWTNLGGMEHGSPRKATKSQHLVPTVVGLQRKQRTLEKLKNDKFILTVELYRWLEGLEKDKPTTMARKTLSRMLCKLQQEGLCKCIQVSIPGATNFSRTRGTEVILLPSIDLSSELLDQICERQRIFDIQSRGGSARPKIDQPVAVLTDVKQSSNHAEDKRVTCEVGRANGYVPAKMVRVKLFYYFLWDYVSSLPDWYAALNPKEQGCDLKDSSHCTRYLFARDAAIMSMPLELFLQIVGSSKVIDDMLEHCRLRRRLLDLPGHDYKSLMDTRANAKLSNIINILLRLKLIRLVREELLEDVGVQTHTILTHAMELKPYIEEPLPIASNINTQDLRPRVRHDFLLSKKVAVDAYWETLEYCYAAADSAAVSHAFPGSVVKEVCLSRSWTSLRVMTAEQRMELNKRVTSYCSKKMPFTDCVKIAKELDLTVEQVLRVYYDKRQSRLHAYPRSSECEDQENHMNANNPTVRARKRRRDRSKKNSHVDKGARESSRLTLMTPKADEDIGRTSTLASIENHDSHLPAFDNDSHANAPLESDPQEENAHNSAFVSQYTMSRRKPTRQKRFSWTEDSDRQLVMQYARYRATLGARISRVDWTSVSDLPALPHACRRRMAILNSDENIRRAVMRLCNLLGERFARYLGGTSSRQEKEFQCNGSGQSIPDVTSEDCLTQNPSAIQENTSSSHSRLCVWDDFEDPDINRAVNEVLRYKRITKIDPGKKVGPGPEKEWSNFTPTDGTHLDAQECVTLKEPDKISIDPGNGTMAHVESAYNNCNNISTTGRRRSSSHHPRSKFLKLLNKRGIDIRRQVCESVAVSNAIELLKLVFLSTSSNPEVQTSLGTILQLYSEYDLFAAFTYLKDQNFMVIGHASRPFVLSKKFWHNASSSPFPVNSGKGAANFSTWLVKQEKELKEHGVNLSSDLQCGEIFHLFSLVSSGELIISPCLPKEGIGEADCQKSSDSFFPMEDICAFDESKSLKRRREKGKLSSDERGKRQKPQVKIDPHFCSRREKGFPGIKILLNHASIRRHDVQCLTDKDNYPCSLSYEEKSQGNIHSTEMLKTSGVPSLSSKLNSFSNFSSNSMAEKSQNGLPWDKMSSYAVLLSSKFVGPKVVDSYSPKVLKFVHSIIHQAGEQGLNMEEVAEAMDAHGMESAKIVVDTLEVFKLAIKVNAYDSVRILDSSYRSKYFIRNTAGSDQGHDLSSYMKSRASSYEVPQKPPREKHDTVHDSQREISMKLSDVHEVTILDLPKEPALTQIEYQPIEVDVTSNDRMQFEIVPSHGNKVGDNKLPVTDVLNAPRPILPWINGDGSINIIVHKGLTRRVLGTIMQNPGILEEDIIGRMDVLNPQSCRHLLESMILDNHITERMMRQTTTAAAPPGILQDLFGSNFKKPESVLCRHYFANPMSTHLL